MLTRFTQEEADYAVEHVNFDWKENAVKEAESYANGGNISKERLLEILVENRKFTQEEAEYAIEHAKIDCVELNNNFNFDFCNILKSWIVCQLFFCYL